MQLLAWQHDKTRGTTRDTNGKTRDTDIISQCPLFEDKKEQFDDRLECFRKIFKFHLGVYDPPPPCRQIVSYFLKNENIIMNITIMVR